VCVCGAQGFPLDSTHLLLLSPLSPSLSFVRSNREAAKYLYQLDDYSKYKSCNEIEGFTKRARSLLVVVSTPPTKNYEEFTDKVRKYSEATPFEFRIPTFPNKSFKQFISIYAAYLYDAVKLYANALHKLLTKETRPLTDEVIREIASNGTAIINAIIQEKKYPSEWSCHSSLLYWYLTGRAFSSRRDGRGDLDRREWRFGGKLFGARTQRVPVLHKRLEFFV
jgi:hypothetical protein